MFCKFCGKRQEGSNTICKHCKSPLPELQHFGNTGFVPANNLERNNGFTDGSREEMGSYEDEQLASVIRAKASRRKGKKDNNIVPILFFAWMILMTIGMVYLIAENRRGGESEGMVVEIEELEETNEEVEYLVEEPQREEENLRPTPEVYDNEEDDIGEDENEAPNDFDTPEEAMREFMDALSEDDRGRMAAVFDVPDFPPDLVDGMPEVDEVVDDYLAWFRDRGYTEIEEIAYISLDNSHLAYHDENVVSRAFLFSLSRVYHENHEEHEYIVVADFVRGDNGRYHIQEMGGMRERYLGIPNDNFGRTLVSEMLGEDPRWTIYHNLNLLRRLPSE